MKKERTQIFVSHSIYKNLKRASEKSGVSMIRLADAIITKEINWLNDPIKIAEYFKMCKE